MAGTQLYSLTGRKLTIQKKKIDFFRVGLLKEAVIDHASFTLTSSCNDSSLLAKYHPGQGGIAHNMPSGFFGNNVSALACEPISFTVNQTGQAGGKARIVANRAEFLADDQTVKFRGNVRLNSGHVSMETNELELSMDDCLIAVMRPYTLARSGAR